MKDFGLSIQQIEAFASRPGTKRIAVENFLDTLSGDQATDLANLVMDRRLYGWNEKTVQAIHAGITLAYS